LIVALPREIPTGFVRISGHQTVGSPPFVVYRHETVPSQLVAAQVGVGQTRAAGGARQLIERFSPCALVSFGFAGGLTPQLTRGTVVIGTALVSADSSGVVTEAHRTLSDQFHTAAAAEGLPVQRGAMVTVTDLVADVASKAALQRKYGASAVDMETAGVVRAAREAGLPWAVVRAIIDCATDPLPAECLTTLRDDGHVDAGLLIRSVCRSPSLVRHFLTLATSTAMARRHLSRMLARWAINLQAQRPLA
jgi:adenosylhomocysteine nucleosidase